MKGEVDETVQLGWRKRRFGVRGEVGEVKDENL